jgi:hypothetical protein
MTEWEVKIALHCMATASPDIVNQAIAFAKRCEKYS